MQMIDAERTAARRNALKRLGIDPDQARAFVSQVQSAGYEAAMLDLPFYDGPASGVEGGGQALQDPATGQPYFMLGVSALGGGDPLGSE